MSEKCIVGPMEREIDNLISKGLIAETNKKSILEHLRNHKARRYFMPTYGLLAIALLLLTAGASAFLSKYWDHINLQHKIWALMGGLWFPYLIALFYNSKDTWFPQSKEPLNFMLLIGFLIFGIELLAIDELYKTDIPLPTLALIWTFAGIIISGLLNVENVLLGTTIVSLFWSYTVWDVVNFIPFDYLVVWAACVYVAVRKGWRLSYDLLLLSLLAWCLYGLNWFPTLFYTLQAYTLGAISAYIISNILGKFAAAHPYVKSLRDLSLFVIFSSLYINSTSVFVKMHQSSDIGWYALSILLGFVMVTFLLYWMKKDLLKQHKGSIVFGQMIFIFLGITCLLTTAMPSIMPYKSYFVLAFNIFYFVSVSWLIYVGLARQSDTEVDMGFILLGMGIISRFLDTFGRFWDNGIFFLGVGALVLVLGIYLEVRRRRHLQSYV